MKGVELTKVKYTHRGNTSRDPLNIDFGINNEKQDCKIDRVWKVQVGWEGEMEKMKVREYG
jgi:hypothetical protein